MNSIDFTPLYRSSIGFDRIAPMLNHALTADSSVTGYPPYNIELLDENHYAITIAVAGFTQDELNIQVEKGILMVRGNKNAKDGRQYLYQGIANCGFDRKFNLADYVEVIGAKLDNGLLTINLVKEIPEAMKRRNIAIQSGVDIIEQEGSVQKATNADKAA